MLEPSSNHLQPWVGLLHQTQTPLLLDALLSASCLTRPEQSILTRRVQVAICLSASPRTDWRHFSCSIRNERHCYAPSGQNMIRRSSLNLKPWGFVGTVCKHLPLATHGPCMRSISTISLPQVQIGTKTDHSRPNHLHLSAMSLLRQLLAFLLGLHQSFPQLLCFLPRCRDLLVSAVHLLPPQMCNGDFATWNLVAHLWLLGALSTSKHLARTINVQTTKYLGNDRNLKEIYISTIENIPKHVCPGADCESHHPWGHSKGSVDLRNGGRGRHPWRGAPLPLNDRGHPDYWPQWAHRGF